MTPATCSPARAQHRSSRRELLAQLNADLATLSYTAGANAGPDQLSITINDQSGNTFSVVVQVSVTATGGDTPPPSGPSITIPAPETVAASQTLPISGVQVVDSYAAGNPGSMALNVSSTGGDIAMTDAQRHGSRGVRLDEHFRAGHVRTDQRRTREPCFHSRRPASSTGQVSVEVYDQLGLSTNACDSGLGDRYDWRQRRRRHTGGRTTADRRSRRPRPKTVAAGQTLPITGVQVVDSFAAAHPGSLALNVSSTGGDIAMTDARHDSRRVGLDEHSSCRARSRRSTPTSRPFPTRQAPAPVPGQISVQVYDQLGLSTNATLPVSITPTSAPTGPTITGTAGDDTIVATLNNTTINSGAGNDNIFLSGTGDVVTTGNGTETVMGFVGGNTITTGSGNDVIRVGGTGSVVNAGLGDNTISDSGNCNTFILPTTGGTDDFFGYVLQNSDLLDLRPLLAATTWNGSQSTLANYLEATASSDGANTMLVVTPLGSPTGGSYTAATFNDSGVISLQNSAIPQSGVGECPMALDLIATTAAVWVSWSLACPRAVVLIERSGRDSHPVAAETGCDGRIKRDSASTSAF